MNKKKVGLLTWHYYDNVGSNLQAYALFRTIINKGFDCKFIDYRKKEFDDAFVKKIIKDFFIFLNKIGIIKDTSKYAFKSKQFQKKYFVTTRKCNKDNITQVSKEFDILLCGSDQIWAPSVFDETYLFAFANNANKNSYAASLGLNSIPVELQPKYKKFLSDFNKISVREQQGQKLLSQIGIKSQVVLDPTFLLEKNQWVKISNNKVVDKQKKYIFCYLLGKNKKQLEYIKNYQNKTKLELIIYSPTNDISEYRFKNVIKRIGPEEFVSYVSNSEHIFTDSYHGCIFSIIFEKKFHIFLRFDDKNDKNSQNSRIYNLVNILNIENALITDYDKPNLHEIEDYERINSILNKNKKNSFDYLSSILEEKK